jgi:hypothetical protein
MCPLLSRACLELAVEELEDEEKDKEEEEEDGMHLL